MRQLYLISYDIKDNARRARVLRAIKGNAIGGQKSVYECWLDANEFQNAKYALASLVHDAADRIVLTRLDPRAAIHTLGVGVPPEDGNLFYLG